tara:strand:- start:209 stop:1639 length:1431 start_codon:yes stop_codon:yes gene_type:complete
MAYKQNNPLSRKKSSPLNHELRDARSGKTYLHDHYGDSFTGRRGKLIPGNERFNINPKRKFRPDGSEERTSAYDENMAFAGNIANIYNQGGFAPGATFRGGTYSNKPNRRAGDTFLNKLTGFRTNVTRKGSTGVPDKFQVQKIGRNIGSYGQEMYNLGQGWNYNEDEGGWNFSPAEGQEFTAPEQQYTPEQIYDLMSQGDGVVQYVEGIGLVSGNPSEQRYDTDRFGTSTKYTEQIPNSYVKGRNTVPEGYELVGEAPVEPKPQKPLTIKEILELRKQQRNKSNSPLNNNHDERSGFKLKPNYQYGDEVLGEIQEGEWIVDPNDPTRLMRTNIQPVSITGERITPEGDIVTGNPVNPNPNNLPPEELDRRFTNYCLENPTDPRCQGFNERNNIVVDDSDVQNINRETIEYKPITKDPDPEPEPDPKPKQPMFSIGTNNPGKNTRGTVSIDAPDLSISLPKIGGGGGSKVCGCPNYN